MVTAAVAGFSLSVPVGLSVGVRVVVVCWWVSVWVGVRLSVCRSVGVFVCRCCVMLFGRLAVPLVPACHGH